MTGGRLRPTIVVHGGAGLVSPENRIAVVEGVQRAAQAGVEVFEAGGGARAAVIAAVRVLEVDPVFNAGRGACMNRAGQFEVDAGLMQGSDRRSGAVAAVPDLADAILVAEAVLDDGVHSVLAGPGAAEFARRREVGTFGRAHLFTDKAQRRYERGIAGDGSVMGQADTVGAVAVDGAGELVAGCSTGGVLLKHPGRVGDSPLCGSGFFAASELGAATATGVGEAILSRVVSFDVLRRMAAPGDRDPWECAREVCAEVVEASPGSTCGVILITPGGEPALAHASPHMSWAIAGIDRDTQSGLVAPDKLL